MIVPRKPAMLAAAVLLALTMAPPRACLAKPAAGSRPSGEAGVSEKDDWARLARDDDGKPLALETAIGSYRFQEGEGRDDVQVDLVGAIHVGDKAYYRGLNKRFRSYDTVLYELVAPDGTVVPRGRGASNDNLLGAMQNGLKSMLELEHQLEQIDYTRRNFRHADLSPEEFLSSMERREESFSQMYFRMVGQALAQQSQQAAQGESADMDIFMALMSEDRPRRLKIALAKQFESMETLLSGFSGPEGSTLITERNRRALDVLEKRNEAGDRRIAVFYGAGHLPDMHRQLVEGFKMRQTGKEWLEAWDLRPSK